MTRSGWGSLASAALVLALQAPAGIDVPVEQSANVFFARATINDDGPFWLTVDTGATLTVLDPTTVERLGLRASAAATRNDVGIGAGPTTLRTTTGAAIRIADLAPFTPAPQYVVGVRDAEAGLGHRIDGILGHDFLRRFVVELDYARGALRLHPPGTKLAMDAAPVPASTADHRLVVPALLILSDGGALTARLLVDTGSSGGISLNTGFAERHRLEMRFPSTDLSAAIGINGMTVRAVMHLRSVSIGDTELPVTRVALSRERTGLGASTAFDGILGAAALADARLIIDYAGRTVRIDSPIPR